MDRRFVVGMALVVALSARTATPDDSEGAAPGAGAESAALENYVLDYPAADRFCPPVQTFFDEVVRTFEVVRGRRFTHQPNGGYGLPVVQKVDGRNLLHLGADVGWYRPGEPVYSVAAGVVRASDGPLPDDQDDGASRGSARSDPAARRSPADRRGSSPASKLAWGNVVMIEHRLPTGEHFTTVYGHLGSDRLVKAGDVVEAGQPIGTIGRKHARINGGYDPHLHFALRQGRLAEPGCTLVEFRIGGQPGLMKLVALGEDQIEVEMPSGVSASSINLGGRVFPVSNRDGKHFLPARLLWDLKHRPGFEIVGYGLSTEGWHDPVAFLRQLGADRNPAPFRDAKHCF